MPYEGKFPQGTLVQVALLQVLEKFRSTWKYHHPLQPEQLQYAGLQGKIASVGFYHGGDILYQIEGIPGTWHECCLQSAAEQ